MADRMYPPPAGCRSTNIAKPVLPSLGARQERSVDCPGTAPKATRPIKLCQHHCARACPRFSHRPCICAAYVDSTRAQLPVPYRVRFDAAEYHRPSVEPVSCRRDLPYATSATRAHVGYCDYRPSDFMEMKSCRARRHVRVHIFLHPAYIGTQCPESKMRSWLTSNVYAHSFFV